jgi:hypothetical protein
MRWLLKRWWFWGGTGFVLVAVAMGYLVIPVSECQVTEANYAKIQDGWTAERVEELLGYHGLRSSLAINKDPRLSGIDSSWSNDDGLIITVSFDSDLVVLGKALQFLPIDRTLYDRIKHRIEQRIEALWR